MSGCFVEDIATPAIGERVTITLRIPGGAPIEATGRVAYTAAPLGFAVAFDDNDHTRSALHAAALRISQRR